MAGLHGNEQLRPLGWMREKREERANRRLMTQRARVVAQVELLGPQWRVLDLNPADPDFIAIGPGGIFSVTVCDHGRSKVELAGEVVQIEGRRPPYVQMARKEAQRISDTLSAAAGRRIPVIPMLAFMGTGQLVYWGKPPEGCVVSSYRDLRRALDAHGNRLGQPTIDKLCALADHPDTWTNHSNEDAPNYQWYPEGTSAADKSRDRR
ncbi:hypothetical protein GCM10009682_05510 [Luedemannella flava]|uniref:Nuclease n=2 Tax=Luedemannella flava TaxID=349316 RepID=A0ABP4XNS6_9ACTN